jgi:hypothetical protein
MKKFYVAYEHETYVGSIQGDWVWEKCFESFDNEEEADEWRHDIIDSGNSFRNVTSVMVNDSN